MDKLINYIERNAFDDQMYWVIPRLYSGAEIEIQWRKSQESRWRFRQKGQLFWTAATNKNIISLLNKEKVDLAVFDSHLRASILQQVVFAKKLLEEAGELFSQKQIEDAVKENDRFLNELRDAILALTSKKRPLENKVESDNSKKKLGLQLVKKSTKED